MIELCPGTCKEIANIERMLKFIGNVELRGTDIEGEPLFDKQKIFDSQIFQRSYYIYAKGRSVLSPIRVKFVYDMREGTAVIKAPAKDAEILNRIILGKSEKKETASEQTEQHNTEPRTDKVEPWAQTD